MMRVNTTLHSFKIILVQYKNKITFGMVNMKILV